MKYIAIIPARYASTRFPGKPLAKLGNETIIKRVYTQVSKTLDDVWVATDDDRIYDHVKSWGGNVVITRNDHQSGTDRIEEAMEHIEDMGHHFDVVVNVQGDEPFIQPEQIESVCQCFDDSKTQIATLGIRFVSEQMVSSGKCDASSLANIKNPNSPKVITDNNGFAMYFSRSVIPFLRNVSEEKWAVTFPFMKHIGIYAYRRNVLKEITQLPQSPLEKAESLEQLRWLQNGYKIKVGETHIETIGIDTPDDLTKAQELIGLDA